MLKWDLKDVSTFEFETHYFIFAHC